MAWDPLTDTHEKHMDSAYSSPSRCGCSLGVEYMSSQLPHSHPITSPLQESGVLWGQRGLRGMTRASLTHPQDLAHAPLPYTLES